MMEFRDRISRTYKLFVDSIGWIPFLGAQIAYRNYNRHPDIERYRRQRYLQIYYSVIIITW